MKEPSKEQIKERAKFLRQVLLEKHKIDLPHGHSLEVLAKVFGFKDWNTAAAHSTDASGQKPAVEKSVADTSTEKPIAVKLPSAGELADFFAKFDRDTKVFVNEYKGNSLSDIKSLSSWDSLSGTMTSICSLTYDSEIQNGTDVRLELNTEEERDYQVQDFGKSSNQTFDATRAGRSQRRVKFLYMQNSFWNSGATGKQ
jgi:hypothetical protein